MITKHKNIRRWLTSFAVVTVLLAAAAPVFPESALATTLKQGGTTVTVSPAKTSLTCNQSKQVDILINDVTDLFGVDLKIGYDPNVVEVVDADAANPGVQVKPGNLPDVSGGQGLVQENIVDVATGTINYSAIRLAPAPAQSGSGIIVSITFKGKAAGSSPVKLTAVALADETALPIEATKTDGAINVTCDGQTPGPTTATATRPPGGPTVTPPPNGKATPVPPYGKVTPVPGTGKGYPTYPGKGGSGGTGCTYVVKPGDTMYSIALAYGVTVQSLASANGIANPNYIYAGQTLVIPGCGGTGQPQPPTSGDCFSYTVQAGDTLSSIARAYGDTVAGLTYRNGIVNPNLIRAGQTLTVCPGGGSGGYPGKPTHPTYPPTKPGTGQPWPIACAQTYVVQPGDTLYSIGLAYGVSVNALMKVNNLNNPNWIRVGDTLCIPSY